MFRQTRRLLCLIPLTVVGISGCADRLQDDPTYGPAMDGSVEDVTNRCAVPGDPICPLTPIEVPGPFMPEWGSGG